MRIQVRRWVVVLTLSLLWGFVSQAEAGTDEAGRCSALMLRGYEKGLSCSMRLERMALLNGDEADTSGCDSVVARFIRRAKRRFGEACPSESSVADLVDLHGEASNGLVEAVSEVGFTPDKTYIVITLDDGLRAEDMPILEPFLALKNPDQSAVRMTSYTRTNGTEFALLEHWYATGNEVANHTVSHGPSAQNNAFKLADDWSPQGASSWTQELTDQDAIMALWGNVPSNDVVGFRCPYLGCNQALFATTLPAWAEPKLQAGAPVVYDTSLGIIPGPADGFAPPFPLSKCSDIVNAYANQNIDGTLKKCESPPQGCTAGYDCAAYWGLDDLQDPNLWEFPIPPMLRPNPAAGQLPYYNNQEPSDGGDSPETVRGIFAYNYQLAKNTHTPMMIALHTSWLQDRTGQEGNAAGLLAWMTEVLDPSSANYDSDIRFVTAEEVVKIYAAEDEGAASARTPGQASCDYSAPTSSCAGLIPSRLGGPSGADCDSQCGSSMYGQGAGGALCQNPYPLTTTTCNATCGGPEESQQNSDFTPGAGPWTGNVGGNCTLGDTCGFYPEAAVSQGAQTCSAASP